MGVRVVSKVVVDVVLSLLVADGDLRSASGRALRRP
jgi:hypothetical protein